MGIRSTWPFAAEREKGVSRLSTLTQVQRHTNFSPEFRSNAPGSNPASTRIWKPLQIPRMGTPASAILLILERAGLRAAIAPALR